MKKKIKFIVDISDLHVGSKLGLMPERYKLKEGTIVVPGRAQEVLLEKWIEFQKWVKKVVGKSGYALLINGDAIDGDHHNTDTIITKNLSDQVGMAERVLEDIVSNASAYYHITGTEAHSGRSGTFENDLAKNLGAIPDEHGIYARDELWLRFGDNGILCHATHHISTTSSQAYESTAGQRELIEFYTECARWERERPDVILRGHRHRHYVNTIATNKINALVVITPGWQLKSPFVMRGLKGRTSEPQIGGSIIVEGSEVPVYERHFVYSMPRQKEEVI